MYECNTSTRGKRGEGRREGEEGRGETGGGRGEEGEGVRSHTEFNSKKNVSENWRAHVPSNTGLRLREQWAQAGY